MSEKDYTVKPGEELVIKVRKAPRTKKTVAKSKRNSIIYPKGSGEYLARRRKKSGLLNFYDLGYRKNSSTNLFEDIDFTVIPIFTESDDAGLTNGDYLNRDGTFLAIPTSEWSSKFKKFKKIDAEKYGLHLDFYNTQTSESDQIYFTSSEDEFTDEGIKLTALQKNADDVRLIENPTGSPPPTTKTAFYEIKFKGIEKNRITTVYDPAAEDVEVDLTGKVDIYLAPKLMKSIGVSRIQYNGQEGETRFLNYFYTPLSRDVIFNESSPYYNGSFYQNEYDVIAPNTPEAFAQYSNHLDFMKNMAGARAFFRQSEVTASIPIADFPGDAWASYPPGDTSNVINNGKAELSFIGLKYPPIDSAGILIAVIIKNQSKYYVWST